MTNFELYKPYKTRGGWKAICVDFNIDGDPVFCHIKNNSREVLSHFANGNAVIHDEYIISEWSEPIKRTFWVNVYADIEGFTEEVARKIAGSGCLETIRAALTAQSETGNDLICYECAKEHGHFYTGTPVAGKCCVCGRALLVDRFKVTPPRTEDATKTVTLSKEDFERVKDILTWIADPRDEGFPIKLNDTRLIAHMVHTAKEALSILKKEIKP